MLVWFWDIIYINIEYNTVDQFESVTNSEVAGKKYE